MRGERRAALGRDGSTVDRRVGRRTWEWKLETTLTARLLPNGGVGFVDPATRHVSDLTITPVAILDATNAAVATAVTDATGFYFFPAPNAWSIGSTSAARVAGLPAGVTAVTPLSQTFAWEGAAGQLADFVVK